MLYGRNLILFFCILISSPDLLAQQDLSKTDLTGLWKGTIYNDTTKMYYRYEIGISNEKGKLTGFSHTWFIQDDKQYYGVKKIKVAIKDGKLITQDNGLIANNYPVPPDKGVYQLNVLELQIADSVLKLSGPFTTNRTKKFRPLTGTVSLQRKNDYWNSSLVPHLKELGVSNELSFVEDSFSLEKSITKVNTKEQEPKEINPVVKVKVPAQTSVEIKTPAKEKADDPSYISSKPRAETNNPAKTLEEKRTVAAADINNRITVQQEIVFFKSDSLQLSLYDNGEVDGDTVSVLMNGSLIMAKQGLSTNAIRKTIYIPASTDSIQLVMYAENLGSIAPNTGLLVVRDGKDIYEVRFSGDLQKNAAVIFRRKK